jgi:hypothetical protein
LAARHVVLFGGLMPAYGSISATTWSERTNTTITAPASIADGNQLLLAFCTGAVGTAPTATPPSGFDPVAGTWPISLNEYSFNIKLWLWEKVAASESGNYTATHASSYGQGVMARYTDPGDLAVSQNQGTGTTTTATGLTVAANSLVIFINADYNQTGGTMSPPSGSTPTFNERYDSSSAPIYWADGVWATGGATGNKTATSRNTESISPWAGLLIEIAPAGGGTPTTVGGYWGISG